MHSCKQVKLLRTEQCAALRIDGGIRFEHSPCIEYALEAFENSKSECDIIFDLRNTTEMDSTVLGTLARFIVEKACNEEQGAKQLVIVCATPKMTRLLNQIGLAKFIHYKESDDRLNSGTFENVNERQSNKSDLEKYVLDAHQTLSDLNQDASEYKAVIKSLNDKKI